MQNDHTCNLCKSKLQNINMMEKSIYQSSLSVQHYGVCMHQDEFLKNIDLCSFEHFWIQFGDEFKTTTDEKNHHQIQKDNSTLSYSCQKCLDELKQKLLQEVICVNNEQADQNNVTPEMIKEYLSNIHEIQNNKVWENNQNKIQDYQENSLNIAKMKNELKQKKIEFEQIASEIETLKLELQDLQEECSIESKEYQELKFLQESSLIEFNQFINQNFVLEAFSIDIDKCTINQMRLARCNLDIIINKDNSKTKIARIDIDDNEFNSALSYLLMMIEYVSILIDYNQNLFRFDIRGIYSNIIKSNQQQNFQVSKNDMCKETIFYDESFIQLLDYIDQMIQFKQNKENITEQLRKDQSTDFKSKRIFSISRSLLKLIKNIAQELNL